jgi:hypothetical protein
VFASDPVMLGYLTAWAAHYLLTGHTFKPGAYQVGQPDRARPRANADRDSGRF